MYIPIHFEMRDRRKLAAVMDDHSFATIVTENDAGFEIDITRLEGKFKLSQNRSNEDIAAAIEVLQNSENETDRELAALMANEYATQQIEH